MTNTSPAHTHWGVTWSKRWHALVPADGGIRNEPATACGGYAYDLEGPHVPAHIHRAAADPRTPVCKRCVATVGPMPKQDPRGKTNGTDPVSEINELTTLIRTNYTDSVDEINTLAALIREIDGNHTLGAAALAEALINRGVTLSANTR